MVVILAGTNDIAGNTGPISLEDIEANFATMVELARAHGIRVVLSSVIPVHNYTPASELTFPRRPPEKIAALNKWLKDYAATSGCVYLDYAAAMSDDKGMLRRELADDGLHPNPAGYAIMAPLAEQAIGKALKAGDWPSPRPIAVRRGPAACLAPCARAYSRPCVSFLYLLGRAGRAACGGGGASGPPAETDDDFPLPLAAGLSPTPPMGWNSWNKFACNINDDVRAGGSPTRWWTAA